MTLSHVSPRPGILQLGLMGNVSSITPGFSLQHIMYFNTEGVNSAVSGWGRTLRSVYGKADASVSRNRDITLQYVGYTTDNGAYYYYNTEPGKDYGETLVDVKKYSDEIGVPYAYVLLDSWWYYKGSNGGISNWTARPEVFPLGLDGLYQHTGWKVQAHNRYWSPDNVYAKQNGGQVFSY